MSSRVKSQFVQFRLSPQEYETFQRVANMLHEQKILKNNSVASLVRTCAFTQVNQWLMIEAKQKAIEEYDRKQRAAAKFFKSYIR